MRLALTALCFLPALSAQQLPDAREVLKQSGDAIRNHRSYQIESEMMMDMMMGANPMKMTIASSIAGIRPDKTRFDSKTPMGSITIISDGEYTWTYFPSLQQYSKKAAIGGIQTLISNSAYVAQAEKMAEGMKVIRDETIDVAGGKHDCWVIESRIDGMKMPQPPGAELTDALMTLWIDKQTHMNLKMSMSGKMQGGPMPKPVDFKQAMEIRSVKFDVDLPDSMFRFTPPAGAKEVEDLGTPGLRKPDLAGKPAPAFQVKSLDGKDWNLAAVKGKTVLLDFWATWCSPCRKELPVVEKLYREFSGKGLLVLGVNAGEDQATVEAFLKKNPAGYPIALSGETGILPAFQVTAFPTYVVIGPDGKVVSHEIGAPGETGLRNLIEQAGLKAEPAK